MNPARPPIESSADVVVVGAGLAGLQCARLVGEAGLQVLLLDRKADPAEPVHTTGIFVRKSFEDFDLPESCLGPPLRRVSLYSPGRRVIRLESRRDEFRVGRMRPLYHELLARCRSAGVRFRPGTRYRGCRHGSQGLALEVESAGVARKIRTRFLVGADGAGSRVARDLGLDRNTEFLVGLETVHAGVPVPDRPGLHCFLDPDLAPGYLAWVVQDGEETHVGVGGYPNRFRPRKALREFVGSLGDLFELERGRVVEERGGQIPVNGILRRIGCERGLLVGDAAGAVSPLTAGGFDACLRLSRHAAEVIARRFESGQPAAALSYSGKRLRSRFLSRRGMRRLLGGVRGRRAMEALVVLLRLPPFRQLAWQIFFRRRSFPDVSLPRGLASVPGVPRHRPAGGLGHDPGR